MEWLKFPTDNLVRHGANMLIHMWRAYLHHIHTIAIFRTVLTARNGECYATSHDVIPSWVADWMMDDASRRIPKSPRAHLSDRLGPWVPGSRAAAVGVEALGDALWPWWSHGDPIDSDSGVPNSPIRIVTFAKWCPTWTCAGERSSSPAARRHTAAKEPAVNESVTRLKWNIVIVCR